MSVVTFINRGTGSGIAIAMFAAAAFVFFGQEKTSGSGATSPFYQGGEVTLLAPLDDPSMVKAYDTLKFAGEITAPYKAKLSNREKYRMNFLYKQYREQIEEGRTVTIEEDLRRRGGGWADE